MNLRRAACALAIATGAGFTLAAAPPAASDSAPAGSLAPPSSGSASSAEPLPLLQGDEIPSEASKPPKGDEWKAARAVRIRRDGAAPCSFVVMREWLRLRCPQFLGGGLVAGDAQGVSVTVTGNPFADSSNPDGVQNQSVTTVVLPLQRGQVRVLTFLQMAEEYSSASYAEAGTLSVVWRAGQRDPVLVMTQVPAPSVF